MSWLSDTISKNPELLNEISKNPKIKGRHGGVFDKFINYAYSNQQNQQNQQNQRGGAFNRFFNNADSIRPNMGSRGSMFNKLLRFDTGAKEVDPGVKSKKFQSAIAGLINNDNDSSIRKQQLRL